MTYTPGIPSSGQSIPAQDRSLISENFTQLNTQFAIDHTAFDSGSNNGYHKKTTLIQQGSAPSAISNAMLLYTKLVGSVNAELFGRRASNDGSVEFQWSLGNPKNGANTAKSTNNYQSFIPAPLIIKFGQSIQAAASRTIIFTTDANLDAFPNNCFGVFLSGVGSSIEATIFSQSVTQFTMNVNSSSATVAWLAIGN